ncbi:putative transcription factor bHLH family [Helianthus debilis subsp. tardiflorus]
MLYLCVSFIGCSIFCGAKCTSTLGDTNVSDLEVDLRSVFKEFTAERQCEMNQLVSHTIQEVVEGYKSKRMKLSATEDRGGGDSDGQHKVSHITVERNRRKQMNEHLSVLRSLMPCFYVKRGDQASIIGGVVDYITELQQILRTLEAKKQRKVYSESILSPRIISSPRKPPLSPRLSLPISPRTPQPASPYRPMLHPLVAPSFDTSPSGSFTNSDHSKELVANSRSAIAEVEVKFVGGDLLVKTCSNRIPGQATKVVEVLENLSLEVLQVNISVVDEAMVNSFTIKIGVECKLSAEELVQHIQQTFC